MALTSIERENLIQRYETGPTVLGAALAAVPDDAIFFRPAPDAWSVHEIILHCADSETMAASRIRLVATQDRATIVAYDEADWAIRLDYHALPMPPALSAIAAVRANTAILIRTLPDDAWDRAGHHTAAGPYSAEDWLHSYAVHLHDHADQIAANVAAWNAAHTLG